MKIECRVLERDVRHEKRRESPWGDVAYDLAEEAVAIGLIDHGVYGEDEAIDQVEVKRGYITVGLAIVGMPQELYHWLCDMVRDEFVSGVKFTVDIPDAIYARAYADEDFLYEMERERRWEGF